MTVMDDKERRQMANEWEIGDRFTLIRSTADARLGVEYEVEEYDPSDSTILFFDDVGDRHWIKQGIAVKVGESASDVARRSGYRDGYRDGFADGLRHAAEEASR